MSPHEQQQQKRHLQRVERKVDRNFKFILLGLGLLCVAVLTEIALLLIEHMY